MKIKLARIRELDLSGRLPKKDSLLIPLHIGLFIWFGWIPFFLVLSDNTADRTGGIVGLIILLALMVIRFKTWRRLPYSYARDQWEKDEFIRSLQRRLEHSDSLLNIGPYEFEAAIGRLYSKLGMTSFQTPLSGDGGWDVELKDAEGNRYLVECKQFSTDRTVGRPILQKLHSALITEKAHGAICVTTGGFSKQAIEFASGTGIQLIDSIALGQMMGRAYGEGFSLRADGLCRVCGQTVSFDPDDLDTVYQECTKGHWVKHPFVAVTHPVVAQAEQRLRSAGRWTSG
jgi:restriction system protein